LVTARRFVELGVVGAGEREPTRPSPVDTVIRPLQAPELVGTEDDGASGVPVPVDGAARPPS
jgi:hypothetical protein